MPMWDRLDYVIEGASVQIYRTHRQGKWYCVCTLRDGVVQRGQDFWTVKQALDWARSQTAKDEPTRSGS